MKWIDKYLQNKRISKVEPFLNIQDIVLDIGSSDGILFRKIKKIKYGVGIEPDIEKDLEGENYKVLKGVFPVLSLSMKFDAITVLAVLEHVPLHLQQNFALSCYSCLNKKGKLIITVPSSKVDLILRVLKTLHLIDGMNLHEHYGFDANKTPEIFKRYFKLILHKKFQFGLNNLFIFQPV